MQVICIQCNDTVFRRPVGDHDRDGTNLGIGLFLVAGLAWVEEHAVPPADLWTPEPGRFDRWVNDITGHDPAPFELNEWGHGWVPWDGDHPDNP